MSAVDAVSISRKLSREVDRLSFGPPVAHVYNPLEYARRSHELYLERFGGSPKEVSQNSITESAGSFRRGPPCRP